MKYSIIAQLLEGSIGGEPAHRMLRLVQHPPQISCVRAGHATRLEISHAMNLALFSGLIAQVTNARAYIEDVERDAGRVMFDHGAIRTVRWERNGLLPPGEAAFTRFLRPLGFVFAKDYPLPRLNMTGRAYCHADAPESVAQFFISELHPERFSAEFQDAVTRVVGQSVDPLTPQAQALLWELERDGYLPVGPAVELLRVLVGCFARQHPLPTREDHALLAAESDEMAWISTEGNTFNHATDRVQDIKAVAETQRGLGRPIKDEVEVSRSGRVMQTAFQADVVQRELPSRDGPPVKLSVPGSFYEFITRHPRFDKARGAWTTDLSFDAGNAQQIFKMTAAERRL